MLIHTILDQSTRSAYSCTNLEYSKAVIAGWVHKIP